ncbi:alpha/beta hydrolase [Chitinophaga sp. sic0106]|uniref:alpha/beta hydrolase n=1 Tax=Chitinophaga sp. sic0106 TaxID=2854785 RepID=UPI001C486E53|nr:alpha/beta hydrolase [Chitinophaga sp. sic0106]MBV7531362.1 alpha/beta hydrolase [Chitinophaga sp. sic0106]
MNTKSVTFLSNNIPLAANLYLPAGKPIAALVVGHPGTGVKEQAAGLYAQLLAEKGFITLAFDAAYQGESGGLPRGLEDPAQRIEDIKAAVTYLQSIQDKPVGVLGICASGGYGVAAAATDHRIKAIATVSAADIGRQFRNGGDGKQGMEVIQGMLDMAAADRSAKEPGSFPLFPAEEQAKAMGLHVYEGWKYYCTDQGQHPRSAKFFQWKSVELIAGFDAFRFADLIAPRPLLMITGSEAVTTWMTEAAIATAKAPKEHAIIDGPTHVELYYKQPYVNQAVDKLHAFFTENL